MTDKILDINISEYVSEAFYSIPDFTDSEGKHLSGIYGALYKLVTSLKSGEFETVRFRGGHTESNSSEAVNEPTPAVIWQTNEFDRILKERLKEHITADSSLGDDTDSFAFKTDEKVIVILEEALAAASPTGDVKEVKRFDLKMRSTSDLNEVEEIFNSALKFAKGNPSGNIAFYFLTDTVASTKGKHKDILGMALCMDESEAVYIRAENFITADY